MVFYKYLLFLTSIVINLADSEKTKHNFKTIKDDIYKTHYFELENGLKIYLVKNDKEPTINVEAIFNVGSKNDPQDNTGLAHYFEHIMFGGTSKIGSLDYEKEKPYLDKIEDLFEKLKLEKDKKKREKIINEIDNNSLKASNFSTNWEYERILLSLGGTNINAFTDYDKTCYHYTISKNNLEKSLKVLSEQLFNNVVRYFSRELQAVYEEYVINNENSYNLCFEELFKDLCNNHPYGVPIIGKEEHLRNPSIKSIKEFYNKYYHPNNLTLLFVGDLDYDFTVDIIEKYFGKIKKKEIPKDNFPDIKLPEKTKELNVITEKNHYGLLFFPLKIYSSDNFFKTQLISMMLNSYLQGLKQENKINYSECFFWNHKYVSFLVVCYEPLDRQSLKVAKDIVLQKINDFCLGKNNSFAFNYVINDNIYISRNFENKNYITSLFEYLLDFDFKDIEKSEILSNKLIKNLKKHDCEMFIKDLLSKPYYIINKNQGNRNYNKIDKLKVSNMTLNNDKKSEFFKNIEKIKSEDIKPIILDYNKSVKNYKYNDNINFYYIKKDDKKLFKIEIRFNCGILNDKNVDTLNYFLQFSKSKNITFNKFCEKLNELGSDIYLNITDNFTSLKIFGISENFDKTIKLISDYISNINFDNNSIEEGIKNYLNNEPNFRLAKIKFKNYKDYIVDSIEIKQFTKEKVKNLFNKVLSAKCDVLFSTDLEPKQFIDKIIMSKMLNKCKNEYKINKYEYKNYDKNKIFIHNISGAQNIKCHIYNFLNKSKNEDVFLLNTYNSYYYSVYFDELRSKNGLTYYSNWFVRHNDMFYDKDYLEIDFDCQPNKFISAFSKTLKLFDFNKNLQQFEILYRNLKNQHNSKRFTDMEILNKYFNDKIYEININKTNSFEIESNNMNSVTLDKLTEFHNNNIKNAPKIIYIEGNLEDIDINFLSKYGEVKNLK